MMRSFALVMLLVGGATVSAVHLAQKVESESKKPGATTLEDREVAIEFLQEQGRETKEGVETPKSECESECEDECEGGCESECEIKCQSAAIMGLPLAR